ncbi:MAG: hypothetical protein N3A01_02360 [Bacteroidales bacterium]|nr:hypothetical protein [Bacteroidales bacterium]
MPITTKGQKRPSQYSIDHVKPSTENRIKFNFPTKEEREIRKLQRKEKKKQREAQKAQKLQEKLKKQYWKTYNKSNEIGTNQSVYKRMKKNQRKAEKIQHNKPVENFFVRMSRKKIKLPKISITKLEWPWKKKQSKY